MQRAMPCKMHGVTRHAGMCIHQVTTCCWGRMGVNEGEAAAVAGGVGGNGVQVGAECVLRPVVPPPRTLSIESYWRAVMD